MAVPVSLFFADGVHLDQGVLKEHCPGAEVFGLAKLEGHAVALATHGGLTVAATPGESVWGLLCMIPATALETLEVFLGVAEGRYAPATRKVVSPAGPRIEAMVYVAPEVAPESQVADAAMVQQVVTAARRAGLLSLAVARLERCGRVKKDSR